MKYNKSNRFSHGQEQKKKSKLVYKKLLLA